MNTDLKDLHERWFGKGHRLTSDAYRAINMMRRVKGMHPIPSDTVWHSVAFTGGVVGQESGLLMESLCKTYTVIIPQPEWILEETAQPTKTI